MNGKRQSIQTMLGILVAASVLLLVAQGCKKEEPVAQPSQSDVSTTESQSDQMSAMADQAADTATEMAETAKETATDMADQAMAAVEQTMCPIMDGNPINKDLFVEYKGKKVYFCCKGCEETFLADPEAYIAKLPQFK